MLGFLMGVHHSWLASELLLLRGVICWADLYRVTIRTRQFRELQRLRWCTHRRHDQPWKVVDSYLRWMKNGEWSSHCPEKRKNIEYRLSNLEREPWWRLLGIILWEMNRKQFIGERARSSDSGWMWNGLQISVIGSTSYAWIVGVRLPDLQLWKQSTIE